MAERTITASIQALAPIIRQKLESGATVDLTVPGRSMLPTLLDRVSRVWLVPVTEPKKYDMVLYRRDNGTYVLHRIISLSKDGTYVFCGDGQYRREPGIRRDQLIGTVTCFTRGGGLISCGSLRYRFQLCFLPLLRFFRHCRASAGWRIRKLRSRFSGNA